MMIFGEKKIVNSTCRLFFWELFKRSVHQSNDVMVSSNLDDNRSGHRGQTLVRAVVQTAFPKSPCARHRIHKYKLEYFSAATSQLSHHRF